LNGGVSKPARRGGITAFVALCVLALSLGGIGFTTSATAASSAKDGSSGCGTGSPKTAILSLKIDGFNRMVIVHGPTSYSNTTKLPLELNLHGCGSTAAKPDVFTDMDQTADQELHRGLPTGPDSRWTGFDRNIPGVLLSGPRRARRVRQ
jgi:poly(3-hydroxybutyrate) depolymerase